MPLPCAFSSRTRVMATVRLTRRAGGGRSRKELPGPGPPQRDMRVTYWVDCTAQPGASETALWPGMLFPNRDSQAKLQNLTRLIT